MNRGRSCPFFCVVCFIVGASLTRWQQFSVALSPGKEEGIGLLLEPEEDALVVHHAEAPRLPTASVLYGLASCSRQDWQNMVQGQLETWASDLPRESLIIVGGVHDDFHQGLAPQARMPCKDNADSMPCKEASILYMAVDRAQMLNSRWLFIGQDDKYVFTDDLADILNQYDPDEPQIFARLGCGRSWEHGHPGKARPARAHQPPFSCQAVWENGGICGGPGYVVSRAALQRLRSENQSLASFLEEFQRSANTTRLGASDIFASCFFFSRNIAIKQWSSEYTCLDISGNFDTGEEVVADFEQTTQSWHKKKPSALHVRVPKRLVPTAMRAVRALYK